LDNISVLLIFLSFWLSGLMVASMVKTSAKERKLFNFLVTFQLLILFCAFLARDMLIFYIFFESALIPIIILIFIWGNQPERSQAGLYMLFYTLLGSLPLLVVLSFSRRIVSLSWALFSVRYIPYSTGFQLFFLFAFLVKLPIYFFHLWLPKAHVEAPVAGSMLLAGVLLKLGSYGILRVLPLISLLFNQIIFLFIISVALIGSIYIRFSCLRQTDIKALIAYSSIRHIGILLGGLMVANEFA